MELAHQTVDPGKEENHHEPEKPAVEGRESVNQSQCGHCVSLSAEQ